MNAPSDHGRRVALYARVSTSDKEQNPETQLLPLREFVQAQGWDIYRTYIDRPRPTTWPTATTGGNYWKTAASAGLIWCCSGAWTGASGRCLMPPPPWKDCAPGVWGSGPTQSPGWIPHRPSGKPFTTSPWPTPSWREGSSGRGSRQEWTGHGDRAVKSAVPG